MNKDEERILNYCIHEDYIEFKENYDNLNLKYYTDEEFRNLVDNTSKHFT